MQLKKNKKGNKKYNSEKYFMLKKNWYKYSKNILSLFGMIVLTIVVFMSIFAKDIAPYPKSAENYINFKEANKPPSRSHICGTDNVGRDIFSRILFGSRISLLMGVIVLSVSVPIGVFIGLLAGYFRGKWISTLLMRIVDIFVAVPTLLLALVVCSVLTPGIVNAMLAVSISWWSWYARLVYSTASSIKTESYIQAVEVGGASLMHILFREILPNCFSMILTKVSLDMGAIILVGSSISFVGLGAQPPTPDLGTMVADGANLLPDIWWASVFPAIGIMLIVLSFNLVGDGIRDMFGTEEG